MFRRLKKFLSRAAAATSPVHHQQYIPSTEEFSFESLWNDYDRRTWHYDYAKAALGSSNPRLLNWIGSVDQSGYTREKCLRTLISNYESGDENRILLRLADWVPQVQVIAREWILAHFRSLSSDSVTANQRLILYLSHKERLRSDPGMQEIERELLARTKSMQPSEFFGFHPMFRRFLFSLSFANDQRIRPWILDDPEPFNRLLLLSKLEFSEITPDEKERLRADKSIFVRRRLFHAQIEAGVSPEREALINLALDSNRSLRELGQYYLKKYYGDDAYTIYHSLVGNEFFYIADYTRVEDAEHFLEGVRSESRATGYNCLRALISVAPERLKELGIASLIAQNRKFRSALVPLLPQLLSIDEILALRSSFRKSSPHGMISFFRVLERKSFWTFVDEGIAALLSDPEPALRRAIIRAIQSKVAIYEPLSIQLRESIGLKVRMLRAADQTRNERIADLIDFTMKTA